MTPSPGLKILPTWRGRVPLMFEKLELVEVRGEWTEEATPRGAMPGLWIVKFARGSTFGLRAEKIRCGSGEGLEMN